MEEKQNKVAGLGVWGREKGSVLNRTVRVSLHEKDVFEQGLEESE